jgi:transcriptional regulator with XRE-family HTH domain
MSHFPQTSLLVDALKKALKARGVTYAGVAEALNLSEASVKRLFSEETFSLQRLEEVSALAGLTLTELAERLESDGGELRQLTLKQESELVAEPLLFLVFYLLLNQYSLSAILADFALDELKAVQLLARLDRMGLIELHPDNRIRLRVSRFLVWRENGPIRRFFDERVRQEFLESRFDQPGELLKFVSGMLSRASFRVMERKLALLAREFNELARLDAALPLEDRHGCSVMLAQRSWRFSLFDDYARKPGSG